MENGFYRLIVNGVVLTEGGGNFGSSETTTFDTYIMDNDEPSALPFPSSTPSSLPLSTTQPSHSPVLVLPSSLPSLSPSSSWPSSWPSESSSSSWPSSLSSSAGEIEHGSVPPTPSPIPQAPSQSPSHTTPTSAPSTLCQSPGSLCNDSTDCCSGLCKPALGTQYCFGTRQPPKSIYKVGVGGGSSSSGS